MPRARDPKARQRILDAAAPLFYDRGIQAVGMAELAEAADCGKSTMYREYATKEDLVLGYLQRVAEVRDRSERDVLDEADSPTGVVVALVRLAATASARPGFRGCPIRNYLREFPRPDTEAGRFAEQWLRARRRRLRSAVVATGVADVDSVTDQVWLTMEGLWASAAYRDRRRLGAAAVALVGDLLAGQTVRGDVENRPR